MKLSQLFAGICLLILGLVTPQLSQAQSEEEMKAWMEMIAPGEEHELLMQMAGEWTLANTYWMEPGGEPQRSTGHNVSKMVLGNRYLVDETKGTSFGMPMEGRSQTGYDKLKQKFFSTWIDNMGTGIMVFEGTQTGKNEITLETEYEDPMTQTTQTHRMILTINGKDGHRMDYWVIDKDGNEFKSMEVVYSRK